MLNKVAFTHVYWCFDNMQWEGLTAEQYERKKDSIFTSVFTIEEWEKHQPSLLSSDLSVVPIIHCTC